MMKYMIRFWPLILVITGCVPFRSARTVKVILNPKKSGWYYIQIIRDTTIADTGTVKIEFDDTKRLDTVRVNHIEETIVSPYDKEMNSLSIRLKYFGTKEIGNGISFFEFYNPTEEELREIDVWIPTNKRAYKIELDESEQFEKYFKELKRK